MNFFPFHIGDYRSSTAHLSIEEDCAYRRLIEMYMDTEECIPADINRIARPLRINPEVIKVILNEFFSLSDKGWSHNRCDSEIEKYQELSELRRINGAKGGRAKKQVTSNCLPIAKQKLSSAKPLLKVTTKKEKITNKMTIKQPENVSEQVWLDFISHRKRKKSLITETAMVTIIKQSKIAGWTLEDALAKCVSRGWIGFEAEWVTSKKNQSEFEDIDYGTGINDI